MNIFSARFNEILRMVDPVPLVTLLPQRFVGLPPICNNSGPLSHLNILELKTTFCPYKWKLKEISNLIIYLQQARAQRCPPPPKLL